MISILNKKFSKHFAKSILIVLFCHLIIGFFQTPPSVMDESINRGFNIFIARSGYALGLFVLFGIVVPVIFFVPLIIHRIIRKKNYYSLKGNVIRFSLISLVLNFLYGFVFIPYILRSSNHIF